MSGYRSLWLQGFLRLCEKQDVIVGVHDGQRLNYNDARLHCLDLCNGFGCLPEETKAHGH